MGTEFGFFISLDGGRRFVPFMHDLPGTKSDDVLVHPRDQDLVLATHGRSFYVMDDITPLQQLSDAVLAESEHLFVPRPATLWDEDKRTWHGGGDEAFRAKNAPNATFTYYLKAAANGPVQLAIVDPAGAIVKELEGPTDAGIHRLSWDLRRNEQARIVAGSYRLRLTANGRTHTAPLEVRVDPNELQR